MNCYYRYAQLFSPSTLVTRIRVGPRRPFATTTTTTTTGQPSCQWQADVETWRSQLARVDGSLQKALYSDKRGKFKVDPSVFDRRSGLTDQVQSVVNEYRLLVAQLTRAHQQQASPEHKRLTGALLAQKPPASALVPLLETTQRAFLQSACARYYALMKVQASPRGQETGLGELSFTTLRNQEQQWTQEAVQNTRYGRSTKSAKVKKDLPLKARIDWTIRKDLLRTTLRHNQRVMAQLWPWLSLQKKKPNHHATVQCEWKKTGRLSFQKQEVPHLKDLVLATLVETAVHPLCESQADSYSFAWRPQRSASRASHLVAAHLERDISKGIRMLQFNEGNVVEEMSHDAMLQSYPLIDLYRSFLQSFLTAPRRGHRTPQDASPSTWHPNSGVLFHSPLGRALVNNALDGLEDALLQDLALDDNNNVRVVRYGTSILVLGTAPPHVFGQIHDRLRLFLKERGIEPRNKTPVINFQPGTSVEFLGFQFLHAKPQSAHKGRFSRAFWKKRSGKNSKYVVPKRFQVIIAASSMKQLNDHQKKFLSRRRTPAKVDNLINRFNAQLELTVAYFDMSPATHQQLSAFVYKAIQRTIKLLRNKFGSAPKLGTLIQSRFFHFTGEDVRLGYNGVHMAKMKDFESGFRGFAAEAPTEAFLQSNVYLDDCEEADKTVPTPGWIDDAMAPKFKIVKEKKEAVVDEEEDKEEEEDKDEKWESEWEEYKKRFEQ